jgi:photosystem II stability/assembly factor-like uncharacterized protein
MSGAYLTSDGGQSWELLNFPGGAQAFAFDPRDEGRMYVGAAGLHGSTDGGRTWKLLFPDPNLVTQARHINDHAATYYISEDNYPVGISSVKTIFVDPDDSNHLMIGINSGSDFGPAFRVYCTRDGGQSWPYSLEVPSPIVRLLADPIDNSEILVFTRSSYVKLDKADHSISQGETVFPESMGNLIWADCGLNTLENGSIFWAVSTLGQTRYSPAKLSLSKDQGASWKELVPIPGLDAEPEAPWMKPSFSYVASPFRNGRVAYLVSDRVFETNPRGEKGLWYGILKTVDGGDTWNWVYKAGGGAAEYTVRNGWEAGNIQDGWVREAFSGEYIRMLDVGVDPNDPDHAIFTDWYRAMKTSDGGKTWEALYSESLPDGSCRSRGLDVTTTYGVHFDPFDKNHLVISYTDIGYWHSFNGGDSWYRSVAGVPPEWDNTCYWVQFDPAVEGKLWSAWSSWHDIPKLKMIRNPEWRQNAVGGVCISSDGGKTWQVTNQGLPENSPTTCLVLDPNSPTNQRVLYAAVYGQGVFKSTDDGRSWLLRNRGLGENLNAWELLLSPNGTLYLVITHNTQFETGRVLPELMDGCVYRSTDGGESWEEIRLPDKVRFPNSLAVDPRLPKRIYVACWASMMKGDYGQFENSRELDVADGGVIMSEDGGETWATIFDPASYVYSVTVDDRHPWRVYLNTFHNAAFRSDNSGRTWNQIRGYDFRWGHRMVVDEHDSEKVYITTFGGSVFHGVPSTTR